MKQKGLEWSLKTHHHFRKLGPEARRRTSEGKITGIWREKFGIIQNLCFWHDSLRMFIGNLS